MTFYLFMLLIFTRQILLELVFKQTVQSDGDHLKIYRGLTATFSF